MPDAFIRNARSGISTSRWDNGVTAFLLSYQFNGSHYGGENDRFAQSKNTLYADLTPGFNWEAWRLRSRVTYNRDMMGQNQWENLGTYLQRDIAPLRSKILLGDSNTVDTLFDSVPFRGAQFRTDDNMLPDSMRSYAPAIRGTAQSNAEISIYQTGLLIYKTTVPPGPFTITDLYPPAPNGDITINIREANGQERTFIQPYDTLPMSARTGQWKVSVEAGNYRPSSWDIRQKVPFAQTSLAYGLPATTTLYGGVQTAEHYDAIALGLGKGLQQWGALSLDVRRSHADLPQSTAQGTAWRMRYAKSFMGMGTSLSMQYQLASPGYRALAGLLLERAGSRSAYLLPASRAKSLFSASLTQRTGENHSLYFNWSGTTMHESRRSEHSLRIGLYGSFDSFSYDIGYEDNRSAYSTGRMLTASITLPLDFVPRYAPRLTPRISHSAAGETVYGMQISGSALENYRLSYSLSNDYSTRTDNSLGASIGYQANGGNMRASHSQGRGFHQSTLNLSGGLVLYEDGLATGQAFMDTVAIIDAPGAVDIGVDNQFGTTTNDQGRALVSFLTPYRVNTLTLNMMDLSDEVDFNQLSSEVVPTQGAVVVGKFQIDKPQRRTRSDY